MIDRKIVLTLLIIGLLLIPCTYAALNTNLKAPNEFEKASNWNTTIYDIYTLKNDNNTQLYICNYTEKDYDLLFKDDPANNYQISKLSNNTIIGKDNELKDGYILETIETDGNKYIVYILLLDNPTDTQIKDAMKYLTEFNKLNNVEPINT